MYSADKLYTYSKKNCFQIYAHEYFDTDFQYQMIERQCVGTQ